MNQMFYNQFSGEISENDDIAYDTVCGPIEDVDWLENGTFSIDASFSFLTVKNSKGECFQIESVHKSVIISNIDFLKRQGFHNVGIIRNKKKSLYKKECN